MTEEVKEPRKFEEAELVHYYDFGDSVRSRVMDGIDIKQFKKRIGIQFGVDGNDVEALTPLIKTFIKKGWYGSFLLEHRYSLTEFIVLMVKSYSVVFNFHLKKYCRTMPLDYEEYAELIRD